MYLQIITSKNTYIQNKTVITVIVITVILFQIIPIFLANMIFFHYFCSINSQ